MLPLEHTWLWIASQTLTFASSGSRKAAVASTPDGRILDPLFAVTVVDTAEGLLMLAGLEVEVIEAMLEFEGLVMVAGLKVEFLVAAGPEADKASLTLDTNQAGGVVAHVGLGVEPREGA